jgi:hypothetical protein
MRRLLVIYDFATLPSEFPDIRGKFYFIFYQCTCIFDRFLRCVKDLFLLLLLLLLLIFLLLVSKVHPDNDHLRHLVVHVVQGGHTFHPHLTQTALEILSDYKKNIVLIRGLQEDVVYLS